MAASRTEIMKNGRYPLLLACAFVGITTQTFSAQQEQPRPDSRRKDGDLARRLIRKATSQADEDLMDGIIRLMEDAQRKLEIEFDAGVETRELQEQIAEKLDEAIKAAAKQRRTRRRTPSETHPDKRKMPDARDKTDDRSAEGSSESSGSAEATPDREVEDVDPQRGELRELRRGWGHLPDRERDEIIQGLGEGYLDRYRVWIEQYYRALQEADQ